MTDIESLADFEAGKAEGRIEITDGEIRRIHNGKFNKKEDEK